MPRLVSDLDELLDGDLFAALRCYGCGHRWDEHAGGFESSTAEPWTECLGGGTVGRAHDFVDDDGSPIHIEDAYLACQCREFE